MLQTFIQVSVPLTNICCIASTTTLRRDAMPTYGIARTVRGAWLGAHFPAAVRYYARSPGKSNGRDERRKTPSPPDDSATAPLISPTAEDLLKQRFLHAQNKSAGSSLAVGGSGLPTELPKVFRYSNDYRNQDGEAVSGGPKNGAGATMAAAPAAQPDKPPANPAANTPINPAKPTTTGSSTSGSGNSIPSVPASTPEVPFNHDMFADTNFLQGLQFSSGNLMRTKRYHPSLYQPPFDTYNFVKRLEEGGWASKTSNPDRPHDPAESIMEASRALLDEKGTEILRENMDRGDLDNQLYFFSAALSELRTEVTVRARNDVAALRSLASLLQREVEGLEQKMQADVERLKHDIQVEMNHRKNETKGDQNNLEQEIQDLNNRFTIFLSDLRTEIEQSIKWDATRRALALVFGIVAILVCTLALADYLTQPEEEEPPRTRSRQRTALPERQTARRPPAEVVHEEYVPPTSAEEWGLLPRYDTDEGRYV